MSDILEHEERLEREWTGERLAGPASGAVLLHIALAGAIVAYYVAGGFFHSNVWGGAANGGAIRVNLVSSAIPLPSDQPQNKNVLTTDTPSQAPSAPQPKTTQKIDETAIPIQDKHTQAKPAPVPKVQQKVPEPDQSKAQYGEQAGSVIPKAIQGQTTPGPTTVQQGDFGSRFPWYVDGINRKMATSWNRFEVDPRTPKGARVYLIFTIHRDGTPASVQLDRSSGSPTLDRSCMRGVQRVDTFGPLPTGYNGNTLNVSYYCEY